MQTNVQIDAKTLRHSPEHGGGGGGGKLKGLYRPTAEELAASTPTQRNWRGILIALLVIAAVLGLIVFSIALLTPAGDGVRVRGRRVTRAQVLSSKFKPQPFNGTWISDDELVIRDRWGGLSIINMKNLTTRLLINNSTFRELNAVDYKVSPDLKFVLLISDIRKGWRHTRLARYHVYDVSNRNKIPISPIEDDRTAPLLQLAEWSPTGSSLVFVHDNDIYYKPKVLKALVCRITNTGVPGVIFNGVPDFLYEWEVLRLDRALWFSPDGQHLMYATYNDTNVGEHKYVWYGLDMQDPPPYPSIKTIRYPKTNTKNPVVTIYVVSLKTPKFLFPHALQFTSQVNKDWYVRWSSWVSERQVVVLLLNRAQNVSIISTCSATQYTCQDILRDESGPNRWSGIGSEPEDAECGYCGGAALLAARSAELYTSAPVTTNNDCSYRHVVRVTQDSKTPLTHGNWEVTQLLGWDERRRFLYIMGTAPGRAGERHLYRVHVHNDTSLWPTTTCVTCPSTHDMQTTTEYQASSSTKQYENVTSSEASSTDTILSSLTDQNDTLPKQCLYNRIIFSRNFSYYVQECLGPSPPASWVMCVDASGESDRRVMVLSDGEQLRQRVHMLAHPQPKVFRVEVQAGRAARVRLLLPPGFRETDDLPLPLVLQIDASPGSQLVSEKFNIGWGWYLAAARNLIVAQIDARGSGYQGEDLRTEIYRKLLSVDVEDQIAVLTYLRDNLKMVDSSRIAVWGAGYGGAVAVTAAADDARNVTRCVAAICPLTDLAQHNSYWTERYIGLDGMSGLARTAVWRRVANVPPRKLLLAHSTADVSHPPAHAQLLARALVDAQAIYTHHVYPDEGHDLEHSSLHLHRSLEDFLDECFGPVEVADWDVGGGGGFFPFRD